MILLFVDIQKSVALVKEFEQTKFFEAIDQTSVCR